MKPNQNLIPNGLWDMTTVLLNLFPWIDPNNPKDFLAEDESIYFNPIGKDPRKFKASFSITFHMSNGILRHPSGMHTFMMDSKTEAIGFVSMLLPVWLEKLSFRQSVFRMLKAPGRGFYSHPTILLSPSGNAFRELKIKSTSFIGDWKPKIIGNWRPIDEFSPYFSLPLDQMMEFNPETPETCVRPDNFGSVAWALENLQ